MTLSNKHRRNPTMDQQQAANLEKRHNELPMYLAQESTCLEELVSSMGIPDAHVAVQRAWTLADRFSQWLAVEKISDENRNRIAARTAFYLGTYLAQRHSCAWVVMKDEANPAFGRYVVITQDSRAGKSMAFDVFAIAKDIITGSNPGGDLKENLLRFDSDLDTFLDPGKN